MNLAKEPNDYSRTILEAIHIRKNYPTLNPDKNLEFGSPLKKRIQLHTSHLVSLSASVHNILVADDGSAGTILKVTLKRKGTKRILHFCPVHTNNRTFKSEEFPKWFLDFLELFCGFKS